MTSPFNSLRALLPELRQHWRQALHHAARTVVICTIITVLHWLSKPENCLANSAVYTFGIGVTSWLLIDGGRFLMKRDPQTGFPVGLRMPILVMVGTTVGYLFGTFLGDSYSGFSTLRLYSYRPDQVFFWFVLSLVLGASISRAFFLRGKSAYFRSELETAKRQASEAQLKLLQSQLEPHMLFNTLANLRVLIELDPTRAQTMLDKMVDYLRATLGASRVTSHALSLEFARLDDYLSLMQIRMGERLNFSMDLDPRLQAFECPALFLQPLVENAILHGIEPSAKGGAITISAKQVQESVEILISDTGVGLGLDAPDEKPNDSSTQANTSLGFGLGSVRERVLAFYGDQASITTRTNTPQGLCVQLRLPLQSAVAHPKLTRFNRFSHHHDKFCHRTHR